MKNETKQTRIIMNSAGKEDNMEEIQYPTEELEEISYPTDEELERMYEEFLKSESLHKFFDDPF